VITSSSLVDTDTELFLFKCCACIMVALEHAYELCLLDVVEIFD
jgi:hypothetical protein